MQRYLERSLSGLHVFACRVRWELFPEVLTFLTQFKEIHKLKLTVAWGVSLNSREAGLPLTPHMP